VTDQTHTDVLIVGAGFAGLGLGIRLAREGRHDFVILERAQEVGGTWRDNVYPGVACDIPAHLYSFSFRPKADWSRLFAPGAEIQGYLRQAAIDEGLLPHLRFGTEMLDARWDESASLWRVLTSRGRFTASTLVMAAGRLSEPKLPAVSGIESFEGAFFHSSAWDPDIDLTGKRVGVVGTGASAIQLIPQLAAQAEQLVIFQRSAPYVVPRIDHAYSEDELRRFAEVPGAIDELRADLFWEAEKAFPQRLGEKQSIDALRSRALDNLAGAVSDPGLRARATPDYEIGCKRALISSDYYPVLNRPNVVLEGSALKSTDGSTARAASGARYDLDLLVFATGFQSTRPPFAERVTGRDEERLADHWSMGMTAYASTVVSGFPNFFVLDGPNASLGHNSAIYMIEAQLDYVLGALEYLDRSGSRSLEVSAEAEADYTREIDAMAAATVWLTGGCQSWYVDERSGRLTLLWPGYAHSFRERNARFDPSVLKVDLAGFERSDVMAEVMVQGR
jgi:cation diffusion facilitator CzcD-associated flavoprotein CzcO